MASGILTPVQNGLFPARVLLWILASIPNSHDQNIIRMIEIKQLEISNDFHSKLIDFSVGPEMRESRDQI
jgi:hypothetical protein